MKISRLIQLCRPYRFALTAAFALQLVESLSVLAIPWIGGVLVGGLIDNSNLDVSLVAMAAIGLFAIRTSLGIVNGLTLTIIIERVMADMRSKLYAHFQSLPVAYFHSRRPGDQLSVLTQDVDSIAAYMTDDLVSLLPTFLTFIGSVVLMLHLDPTLALPMAIAMPAFILATKLAYRRIRGMSRDYRDTYSETVSMAEENLAILPAIKTFSREAREAERYDSLVGRLKDLGIQIGSREVIIAPVLRFFAAAGVITLLWLSSDRVRTGDLSVTELVSLLMYAGMLTAPISSLAGLWGRLEAMRGSLERFDEALSEQAEDFVSGDLPKTGPREIIFEDVSFSHTGRKGTLKNVSLKIPGGKVMALTGENGAGKSTLVDVILRFNQPQTGRVLLDGVDIAELNLAALRGLIGMVPQQPLLFDGTIRENIVFGRPDVSDEALEQAIDLAHAGEFIGSMPDGLSTTIGSRGIRLSGGQKQRLALARALVKDPAILILDEPTAMFDPDGEAAFVESARDALKGRTVILITHRPASLALADSTTHLSQGRIAPVDGAA